MITGQPTQILERKQQTLAEPVEFSGIGLHTGVNVKMRFCPAEPGTGILFERTDLSGRPRIPATIEYVCDTTRSTTVGLYDVRIHTVEHVLAALKAYRIDNLIIEVSSIEPPVGNGSADVFVEMIERGGITPQDGMCPVFSLTRPVYYSDEDCHLVALPSRQYSISYTLSYPEPELLKAQFFSSEITSEIFKNEIAPCRTFSLYSEISTLMDLGLIKGGSLDNAVVIKDNAVLSKNGLFFPDEMVRHKVLDVIGDLSLVGVDFAAHIVSLRSGHKTNVAFAKKIYDTLTVERLTC